MKVSNIVQKLGNCYCTTVVIMRVKTNPTNQVNKSSLFATNLTQIRHKKRNDEPPCPLLPLAPLLKITALASPCKCW